MPIDIQYIKNKALDFANVPLIDRNIVASVHLENQEDEVFWNTLLQSHQRGRYNFIYESRTSKNSVPVSGVNQCLRYKPYLSKNFFICIDSDLRYLEQQPEIDADHYILQTYTYSWENHYCLPKEIQSRLTNLSPQAATNFDFVQFIKALSRYAYEPLLYLLEALDMQLAPNNIVGQFWSYFPMQCPSTIFNDNGLLFLNQIAHNLQQFKSTPVFAPINIVAAKEKYSTLGLNENNIYLHLRGHNIWGLLNYIGNMICKPYQINFKQQILIPSLQLTGYWQIEKIQDDIRKII